MGHVPQTLLLAAPRGYCAGVDRAVQTVERALELYGAPVYVRKEIVHNKHVVEQLRDRGAVFVDAETEVPEGATVVFSAHGVAPSVHANAQVRRLHTIDATCPLVTKVHREALKFAAEGYTIVLIGHAGHEEVEGTMGEAPEHIVLIEDEAGVDALQVRDPEKVAYISQTTLSVDETRAIINRLRERFPAIVGPRTDDICYATTNRQAAVKQLAQQSDLVLVIGSGNSSNSNRLVEVARELGADSHLIDNEGQVREEWLEGKRVVGITSGASAPEELVQRLVQFFRDRGTADVRELEVVREDVRFMLPKKIRQAPPAAAAYQSARRGGPLRTLVISDLHFGTHSGTDVLRDRRRRAPLLAALAGCDRLVLLGDVLELRHGPLHEALAAAREPLGEVGAALGPEAEVVLLAGNHDHYLVHPWSQRRAAGGPPPPLDPETPVGWVGGDPLEALATMLAPARVRAAYPGVWLRPDVWAMHGHYLDVHMTVPSIERLGAGVMRRIVTAAGADRAHPRRRRTTRRSSRPSTPGCMRWRRGRCPGAGAVCREGRCGAGGR